MKHLLIEYLAALLVFVPATVHATTSSETGQVFPTYTQLKSIPATELGPIDQLQPMAETPPVESAPSPVAGGCGDNEYAQFIYMHESGCNLNAVNAGGCRGIGQDCNGVMWPRCGADYQCQNEYFTSYVNGRYGGWQAAYNFWQSNHWY